MRERPAHADSLDEVWACAKRLLSRGVADRRSAFRYPTLASVDGAGLPRLRTVVLRHFDPAARCLTIHTDRRSAKLRDIRTGMRVALHIYDQAAAIQIRLDAVAAIHLDDPVAHDAWARTPLPSRLGYAMGLAPGTPVSVPPDLPDNSEAGAANLAVLRVTFDRLEWLWLGHDGHRRAAFAWDSADGCGSTWLVP